MDELEYKVLSRMGRCIGCGRLIPANQEKVVRFYAHKSGVGMETLCVNCLKELCSIAETATTTSEE